MDTSAQQAILNSVKSSVVYLDNAAADCIEWNQLVPSMFDHGAVSIKEFSSFEVPFRQPVKKAVFLLTSVFSEEVLTTFQDILQGVSYEYVIIHCAQPPNDSQIGYGEEEDKIRHFMSHRAATVNIFYLPFDIVNLCNDLYLIPSTYTLFPKLVNSNSNPNPNSSSPVPVHTSAIVSNIHNLLNSLNLKEDIYCLGETSSHIGDALASHQLSKNRRKQSQGKKASLLIMDRSLDAIGSLTYLGENCMDSIYRELPSLLISDVKISLKNFSACKNEDYIPVGSLGSCRKDELFEKVALDKSKVVFASVQKQLAQVLNNEKINFSPTVLTKSGIGALSYLMETLEGRGDVLVKSPSMLQVASALLQSYSTSDRSTEIRDEKSLVESADSAEDLVAVLRDIISLRTLRSLGDFLSLVTIGLYLLPPGTDLPGDVWIQLTESLIELVDFTDADVDMDGLNELCKSTQQVVDQLRLITDQRALMKQFEGLADCSVVPIYSSLISQICQSLLLSRDQSDFVHKTSGMSHLFGYLGMPSRSRLADADVIVLLVVGGITWQEYKCVRDAGVKLKKRVILVSNSICRKRESLLLQLLRSDVS